MKHILIADDNKANLIAAKSALSDIYKTTAVLSGAQAFKFLEKNIPDIILLDINMPEMDGFEVFEKIKSTPEIADIPVIFLTADNEAETEQKCFVFVQTVTALSEAVDAKDRYTSGHSKRVAEYSRMIAARMGKSRKEQAEIYRAGLLHDIGKIRIPVEIINKAGKLSDEEYNIIKIHPVTGYHILRGI